MFASLPAGADWAHDLPALAILAGLAVLVVGADVLVRGAVWIALTLGISRMAVGLTLVAMGTSMPELLVSFTAAHSGHSDIAMANVLGSNVANILLIIGVSAAIRAIHLKTDKLEFAYMLVATAMAGLPFLFSGRLDRPLAGAMVGMLVVFCTHLMRREQRRPRPPEHQERPKGGLVGWLQHLALLGAGLVMLAYGAEWLVDGSVAVAKSMGLSDAIVGMTIVAVGTSLPELATSAVAAAKGHSEIAIGNVVGSNIFNVGAVLGIAGLLQPFAVDVAALDWLMIATVVSAVLLTLVMKTLHGVPRLVGVAFLVSYAGYLAAEVARMPG
ncbi:MAG: calcium/sodium antiporter [Planctomycetes bacterium]|nr:calcium/sodium antiporter [Planctomycetota bacterium]